MKRNKINILIVDDDIETSLKYKKWLEEEEEDDDDIDRNFNITLINDPNAAEQIFKPENYDLVLIGFRMSLMDGFDLYTKLYEMSQKLQKDASRSNDEHTSELQSRLHLVCRLLLEKKKKKKIKNKK